MNPKITIIPRRLDSSGRQTAQLSDVDIRAELSVRPRRAPDYQAEQQAMVALAKTMSENPREMLQKLTELALELCDADTAGISLLETHDGQDVFRWEALSGVFAPFRNGTMPRDASPCGICIDRDAFQLMDRPDRCFPALRTEPQFMEALLIPFHVNGRPIGTIWIVSHRDDKHFDREAERIISSLAHFASAGWQLWRSTESSEPSSAAKVS
jgi:transcriptional regulator with GAF, ATPase, and Fis domain